MKFWQYFVGSMDSSYLREKLCAISNTLFPDTQQLNTEQTQQLLSVESRDLPPPLIRVAEVLLSKVRRGQPWHEIAEKLDDFAAENDLGFAVDSKGLVLLLQYYLPPVQARQLYQRLAEQNSTLPFAACLPISHGSNHRSFHLLASHFRNLFVANIPILLSIGLPGCTGKSTFLNKCFECAFPQSSENAFHAQSIDVSLSTDSNSQCFHVFDCHGELPWPIVQLLSSISSIVLVHSTLGDLKNKSGESPLHQLLAAIDCKSKILLLVRDCTDLALSKIPLPPVSQAIHSRLLGVLPVPKIESNSRRFAKQLSKVLDTILKPLLDSFTGGKDCLVSLAPDRWFGLYEQIEQRLFGLLKKSPNQQVTLLARSDSAICIANEFKRLLLQLPKREDKARQMAFPRSTEFAKLRATEANIEKTKANIGEDVKLREEAERLRCAIRSHEKLDQLLAEILSIAQGKDLELYEEFLAILSHFKFTSGTASSESATSLPPEFFWRELLLYAKYTDPKQKPVLQEFLRVLRAWGYLIEIIDGDTRTLIDPELLAGFPRQSKPRVKMAACAANPRREKSQTLPLLCVEAILKCTPTSKLIRLYSNAVPLPGDWSLGLETVLKKRRPLSIRNDLPNYQAGEPTAVYDAAGAKVARVKHPVAFRFSPLVGFIKSAGLIVHAVDPGTTPNAVWQICVHDGESMLANLKHVTALSLVLKGGLTRFEQKDLVESNVIHLLPQLESFVIKRPQDACCEIRVDQALRYFLGALPMHEMFPLRHFHLPCEAFRRSMEQSNTGYFAAPPVLSALSSLGIWQSECTANADRTYVLRHLSTVCRDLSVLFIFVSGEFKPYLDGFRALTGLKTLGMNLNPNIQMNGLSYDGSQMVNSVSDLRIVAASTYFHPGANVFKITAFFSSVTAIAVQADDNPPNSLQLATSLFGERQLFPVVAALCCSVLCKRIPHGRSLLLREFLANPRLPKTVDLSPIIFEDLSHDAVLLSAIYCVMQANSIKSLLLRGPVHGRALPRLRAHVAAKRENAKITAWNDRGFGAQPGVIALAQISEQTDFKIVGTKTSGCLKGEQFSIRVCHQLAKRRDIFE